MAKAKKNRKWVTRAIIAFVVIMGLLVFFSNTIMNMTIPKVVGAYASRGNLSYTNSSTGTIEIVNKTDIVGIEGREIDEVLLRDYDWVNEGDIILTLKPAADDETIKSLEEQLEALLKEKEYADRQPVDPTDYTSYYEAITMAEEALKEANATLTAAQNKDTTIADAQAVINSKQPTKVSLEAEVSAASSTLEDINYQISVIDSQIETIDENINIYVLMGTPTPTPVDLSAADDEPVITPDPVDTPTPDDGVDPEEPTPEPTPEPDRSSMDALFAEKEQLLVERAQYESQLSSAQTRLDTASASLATITAEIEEAQAKIDEASELPTVTAAQSAVNSANSNLTAAKRALTNAQINDGIQADQTQDAIDKRDEQIADLEEQIEEIKAKGEIVDIKATSSGMIYGIGSIANGDAMTKDQVVCSIIPDERVCEVTFVFSANVVDNTMWVGMSLTPADGNYWVRGVTITNIKPNPDNPREERLVKCSVDADYAYPGETVTVVADRANSNYDHVISSSAINEDNNGYFVYVIKASSSPLGDKYVVKRVDVSVEATDGSLSAISGEGLDGVQIVTRSEEPLHDGDRVRLEDYSK